MLLAAALLHNPEIILLGRTILRPRRQLRPLVLRNLIGKLAARGKVVLISSHELETVERVSSHIVILHKGHVVANDSIEQLRALMSLATLESIFTELAIEQDTEGVSRQIIELIES